MSTLTGLDRALVVLIESRLDAIERNLLDSQVARSQRSEIVQAVERQIYGMLEAHQGEVTREVVLRVLGSLDPPEAFRSGEPRQLPVTAAQYLQPANYQPATLPPATLPPGGGHPYGLAIASAESSDSCSTPACCGQATTSSWAFAAMVLGILSIPAIILIPIGTILALIGAICGGIAWFQIKASHGRLGGRGMAIFSFVVFGIHLLIICCLLAFN